MTQLTNWAGNISFGSPLARPQSVAELQELVAASEKVRVLGTGHSFNKIADSTGTLVTVADLPKVIEVGDGGVTVSAGLRYGEITAVLQSQGLALHNLGSLPHISVAGACSTGTHGSGDTNGPLADAVNAITFVNAAGDLVTLTREDPDFAEVMASAYSVSAFTDWVDPDVMVWRKQRAGTPIPADWLGAHVADGPRHPIKVMPADYATQQGGVPGPWNERLPHFRLEFTPSNGDELQSEYFVPRSSAAEAFDLLRALGNQLAPVIQVSEVRTIAADDLWLSPSQGRDTVALHFTWIQDEAAVLPVVSALEDALNPLGARPHWGKVFTADAGYLRTCYPKVADFTDLAAKHDPTGTFRNPYLETYLPLSAQG